METKQTINSHIGASVPSHQVKQLLGVLPSILVYICSCIQPWDVLSSLY